MEYECTPFCVFHFPVTIEGHLSSLNLSLHFFLHFWPHGSLIGGPSDGVGSGAVARVNGGYAAGSGAEAGVNMGSAAGSSSVAGVNVGSGCHHPCVTYSR